MVGGQASAQRLLREFAPAGLRQYSSLLVCAWGPFLAVANQKRRLLNWLEDNVTYIIINNNYVI
jgi:hypothetical protein